MRKARFCEVGIPALQGGEDVNALINGGLSLALAARLSPSAKAALNDPIGALKESPPRQAHHPCPPAATIP